MKKGSKADIKDLNDILDGVESINTLSKREAEVVGKASLPDDKTLKNISKKDIEKVLNDLASKMIEKRRILEKFSEAFSDVEVGDELVSDIVINSDCFTKLRKFGKDTFDPITEATKLKNQFFGFMWGAIVWVDKDADGIQCFQKKSKELGKRFPRIMRAKKVLNIKD